MDLRVESVPNILLLSFCLCTAFVGHHHMGATFLCHRRTTNPAQGYIEKDGVGFYDTLISIPWAGSHLWTILAIEWHREVECRMKPT